MHILVVEDEEKVARFLKKGLEAEGYLVDTADNGKTGERKARSGEYDLVVLDILLPKKNGFEVLQALRKDHIRTPVMMLSALNAKEDVVHGLDDGADDYLPKPFVFSELLARVRSLLRRSQSAKTVLRVGELQLDTITRKAVRGGKAIDLTSREFSLLEYMMRNHSHPVTRQQLAKEIWGYTFDPGTNVIDVYVNHLRKKIDTGYPAKIVQTIRGKGYMLMDAGKSKRIE
ncbi:MAG TPA: response regulator transcription factor [Bacteroidota bacterium]